MPRDNFQPGRKGSGKPKQRNSGKGRSYDDAPRGKRPHRGQSEGRERSPEHGREDRHEGGRAYRSGQQPKRSRFSDRMREHGDRGGSGGGRHASKRPNWEPRDGTEADTFSRNRKPRHGSRYDNARGESRGRQERPDAERRGRFSEGSGGQRRGSQRQDAEGRGRRDDSRGFERRDDRRPRRDDGRGYDRRENSRGYDNRNDRGGRREESRGYDRRDNRAGRDFNRGGRSAEQSDRRHSRDEGRGYDRRDDSRSFDRRDDRGGRGDRDFNRGSHPGEQNDRRPRRDEGRDNSRGGRGDRFDRGERPQRNDRFARSERPQRRDSVYYPQPSSKPYEHSEDVVHERLAAKAAPENTEGTSFADLGLGAGIVGALKGMGAETPFPIQAATIPAAIEGQDVLGRGRTGSGKTIAFGGPVVEYLLRNRPDGRREQGRPPRALVLAPTRELADQINKSLHAIGRAVGIFTTVVTGGVRQHHQEKSLERGVDILIGTPGRIEDLVEQRILDLGRVEIAVLDEADHMAELGFIEPVQRILRQTRPNSQKLMFSATLDGEVATLADEFLREPAVFEVASETQETSSISHAVLVADRHDKLSVLTNLAMLGEKSVFFTRTRAYAEQLAEMFAEQGMRATSLHGDLNQAKRTRNLDKLKRGKVDVLVATDVAARGIHVDDITLVVQADPPDEYKSYVHRAGRTGRAGAAGQVVTVIAPNRRHRMQQLLTNAGLQVPMIPVDATSDVGETLGITPTVEYDAFGEE